MQFTFKASGKFTGIIVLVEAETLEEAKEKAKRHEYEEYDVRGAECINLDINIDSAKAEDD